MSKWLDLLVPTRRPMVLCAVLLVACSLPTGSVCGCPPARSHVIVAGRVRDAIAAPVPGARIEILGIRSTRADTASDRWELFTERGVLTDSAGVFRARIFSSSAPAVYALRLRVIRLSARDTTLTMIGSARFVFEGDSPDSVFVAATVP